MKSFFLSALLGVSLASDSPSLTVVPYPREAALGSSSSSLAEDFSLQITACEADCDLLQRAVERYTKIIFRPVGSTGTVFRQSIFEDRINASTPTGEVATMRYLNVATAAKESVELRLGVDESYALEVPSSPEEAITLSAQTVWGALRGLETFAQLLQYDSHSKRLNINWTPLRIEDSPRFAWRGLLVDSGRHFLSIPLLEKTIDTMSAMKLNVLHWHIVDAESFPYKSEAFPNLQEKSSYHPSATYSQEEIRGLVSYAKDRGVRVVPEFDTPGHTASVGQAYPDLIADCYDWLKATNGGELRWPMFNDVALDVTKSETKAFAEKIVAEMSDVFPDEYFHVGGDEVNQGCWNAVPSIRAWMRQNDFATFNSTTNEWTYDYTGLQGSWTTFIQETTASNHKKAIVWEESFTLGFDLSSDTIVQVWLPDDGTDLLKRIIDSGHKVIVSNGWYLDRQAPTCTGDVCPTHWMWIWTGRDMYGVEPFAPSPSGWVPSDEQEEFILGGEAASWGESVDDKNFDGRVWSRAPGVAERLWSPSSYNDNWEIQPRLSTLACHLARRGVLLADTQPAFCDFYQHL